MATVTPQHTKTIQIVSVRFGAKNARYENGNGAQNELRTMMIATIRRFWRQKVRARRHMLMTNNEDMNNKRLCTLMLHRVPFGAKNDHALEALLAPKAREKRLRHK